MPTTTAADRVYTFSDVSLTINGKKYNVSSIILVLRENSIPSARVVIDPVHLLTEPMDTAVTASLEQLYDIHQKLQAEAAAKAKASLALTVNAPGGTVVAKLDLKDWILTAAGILGVSASGGFSTEVEIQHPIAQLVFTGCFIPGLVQQLFPNALELSNIDMVDAILDALSKYTDDSSDGWDLSEADPLNVCGLPDATSMTLNQAVQQQKARMTKAKDVLEQHLIWDANFNNNCAYEPWPMPGCLDSYVPEIANALGWYFWNAMDTNVWETLVRYVCPQWYVTIIPSYWRDELVLAPFTPWGDVFIELVDTVIADMSFPGVDPRPIAGVYLVADSGGLGDDYTIYTQTQGDLPQLQTGLAYLPKDAPPGAIEVMSTPAWLQDAWLAAGAGAGETTSPNAAEGDGYTATGSNQKHDAQPAAEDDTDTDEEKLLFKAAAYWCARQTYLQLLRQDLDITLSCPLLIKYEGSNLPDNYVIPGVTCSVKAEGGSGALLHFYAVEVIHTIDCEKGVARTQITGRYPRPPDGLPGLTGTTTCNPVYSR